MEESARLTAIYSPEDASYPEGKITVENGTGEATYSNGYLKGIKAGTVVLRFTANDSRQLTVAREIEIVGEKASYAVAGGNLCYNTVSGTIIGCDDTASSANIPAVINGTQITSIAPKAFRDRDNLTSVTIPSSVTNIGEEAFYDCDHITSLRFNGTGLKIIGRYAFYSCESLINLTIPEGIQTIETNAFYDCNGLTNLTIPGGIATIGKEAFRSLDSLKELTISGDYDTRLWLSYNSTLDCVTFTGTGIRSAIHYNENSGEYYQESIPGRNARKVVITDTVTEIGEAATLKLWIVPRTTGLYIYEGSGDVTSQEMDVDCSAYPSLQFDAVAYPEGALTDVYWQSSNEDIAIVDNGLVTFTGLGKVTITVFAADGSGKSASVILNVSFQNSARELTAELDVADNTLHTGETAQLLVFGADPDVPMDPELLEFGIPGSQQDIATVDAFGLITSGDKPGTATVTASMVGDPLGRRVSLKITVKARQTEKLLLHPTAEAPAQVNMLDENGNITNDTALLASYSVVLNKADMGPEGYSFLITPEAFHSQGSFRPEKIALKWSSSNTKVAAVTANADGTATVTVKPGSDGACTISAVTTDEAKVENRLVLNIRNSAPRLDNLKPVLNTYLTEAASLQFGKRYTLYLDAFAQGNAEDGKPTQIKLTVNVKK